MANVSNNKDSIEEKLKNDTTIAQLAREGKELLDQTNRPNVITQEQFAPFIPLFNLDKDRYGMEKDRDYTRYIHDLYNQFIHGLGINLYEVTYVVRSKEDSTVVVFLNRRFTRIQSDRSDVTNNRDRIPAVVAKSAGQTRDNMILEATVRDLIDANNTPEQAQYFLRAKMESALIEKKFTETNMTPGLRPQLLEASEGSNSSAADGLGGGITLVDDDDD